MIKIIGILFIRHSEHGQLALMLEFNKNQYTSFLRSCYSIYKHH